MSKKEKKVSRKDQQAKDVGSTIGVWKIIEKDSSPAQWKAICTICSEVKIKRKNEFKKYTCVCQGYQKRNKNNLQKYGVESPKSLPSVQAKFEATMMERYGCLSPQQIPEVKEKTKKTNLERYGTENPMQTSEVRDKVAVTNLERYGTETPFMSPEIKKKIKETMQERYQVDSPLQSQQSKDKFKKTMIRRYGVESALQSQEFKEKIRQTNLERYGTVNARQNLEIQEKIRQTNLEKYGTEHSFQSPEIQEKIKKTTLKKYGVEYFSQLPEERNKLRDWCEANPSKLFTSKPELEILDFIQQYYPSSHKLKQEGNELDIFIPEINLGIEHNGLFHHSEVRKERDYHLNKTKYFKEKNIRTIHIWGHEWQERRNQVESFLLSALNKNKYKIGARKCTIIWSDSKKEITKAHQLLEDTHIQGYTHSTKYVTNVYYKEDLVATATFGKHHRNSKQWVLSRFVTKRDYTIQGLLSKVTKEAYKHLKSPIISWADYRLSNGNGYVKAGYRLDKLLPIDYFYFKGKSIVSKQSRQKKIVGTPLHMSESEHAKLDGLFRIYDCGKLRFIYEK